jgi:hypothetical protein
MYRVLREGGTSVIQDMSREASGADIGEKAHPAWAVSTPS